MNKMKLDIEVEVVPGYLWSPLKGWTGRVKIGGREVFKMETPDTDGMGRLMDELTPTWVADAFTERLAELLRDGVVDYS